MSKISTPLMDRGLRVTAALCFIFGGIVLTDYFSLFRAFGVMCVAVSPFVFACGYYFRNHWGIRIGVSLLITGVILWFINADMGWQDRYCMLSPLGC